MQVLNQDQVRTLEFVPRRVRQLSPITSTIRGLRPGQGLVIGVDEWTRKGQPTAYGIKDAKYSTRMLADRSGWAVMRIA